MQGRYSDELDFIFDATALPLSIIALPQHVYYEYQARGVIHMHTVPFQPDGTTVWYMLLIYLKYSLTNGLLGIERCTADYTRP